MKKQLPIHFIVMFLISINSVNALCWKAKIMGEREESKPKVIIGEALEAQTFTYPPNPPAEKCLIQLVSSDLAKRLTTDIRKKNDSTNEWILLVNPHGGQSPLATTATCNLSWTLGQGFSLTDFNDDVIIEDMSKIKNFPVTGFDEYLRFKVKQNSKTTELSSLINNLQIISGISPQIWEDSNCDNKIELADAISLINQIAE